VTQTGVTASADGGAGRQPPASARGNAPVRGHGYDYTAERRGTGTADKDEARWLFVVLLQMLPTPRTRAVSHQVSGR
jgi:hypothetical protein